ncbi:hypothetical protein L1987_23676 [Smallanthus sonchifolius]|uniref:Uncharacterized protein n=1 Tax=Smallanthus sonchifolius TaxID=185202 RepID=A0ACB9II42_9ASTR|nr:hypothetical protein L1987_23676 [Smallanthus sonchifolius]
MGASGLSLNWSTSLTVASENKTSWPSTVALMCSTFSTVMISVVSQNYLIDVSNTGRLLLMAKLMLEFARKFKTGMNSAAFGSLALRNAQTLCLFTNKRSIPVKSSILHNKSGQSLETLPFAINYCESLKIADICAK